MNKRLAFLEQMLASGKADAFARYALALEYKKEERFEDAVRTFNELRAAEPDYLPQYLLCGQMHLDNHQKDQARDWLSAGLLLAQKQGDSKAIGEIEAALGDC